MFTNLFFLLIALIIANFLPSYQEQSSSAILSFLIGFGLYLLFLGVITLQIKGLAKKSSFSFLSNLASLELIVFLALYHSYFSLSPFIAPIFPTLVPTLATMTSLLFYLFGLGWAHYFLAQQQVVHVDHPVAYAYKQVQFLIPFCLPFLSLLFLSDLTDFFMPTLENSSLVIWSFNLFLFGLTLIFMPPVVVSCWRCQPLKDPTLLSHLETLCQQTHFKHAGIKIWSVMKYHFTAAIIGIFPRFRYIMFTKPLLKEFSLQEIEAVLAHEIGHSRYKHLLFYPFIFLGGTFLSVLLFPWIDPIFRLQIADHLNHVGEDLSMLILFILILGVYLRFIFGFFSRLFERQADLYIFETPLAPTALIEALDHLAIITGYTHDQPNWHHFSIRERIHFLQSAIHSPQIRQAHHQKVKRWLWFYFIILGITCIFIF